MYYHDLLPQEGIVSAICANQVRISKAEANVTK
jgi:hypothetical protein